MGHGGNNNIEARGCGVNLGISSRNKIVNRGSWKTFYSFQV